MFRRINLRSTGQREKISQYIRNAVNLYCTHNFLRLSWNDEHNVRPDIPERLLGSHVCFLVVAAQQVLVEHTLWICTNSTTRIGATGTIGAAVANEVLKAGYKVRAPTRSAEKGKILTKVFTGFLLNIYFTLDLIQDRISFLSPFFFARFFVCFSASSLRGSWTCPVSNSRSM